jgi:hypothetical protein
MFLVLIRKPSRRTTLHIFAMARTGEEGKFQMCILLINKLDCSVEKLIKKYTPLTAVPNIPNTDPHQTN